MSHHATAVIHEATRLHESVSVGPYAVIEDGVEIDEGSIIGAHAIVKSGTVIGKNCQIDSHAVIGGLPQDLSFHASTPTGVFVGDRSVIREGVTISRATEEGKFTEIGRDCFLMANCHVGHDCRVENNVIIANGVLLAGFVSVGAFTFMGGGAAVHQSIRIGESCMIGGMGRISQDVAPYCMMSERNELIGLNIVGLQRRGFERETIRSLKKLYHLIFDVPGNPCRFAEAAAKDGLATTEQDLNFLNFLQSPSKKGIMRPSPKKKEV